MPEYFLNISYFCKSKIHTHTSLAHSHPNPNPLPGCGAAWLACLTGGQEVVSSNLTTPTEYKSAVDSRLLAFLFSCTRLKKILKPFVRSPRQISASGLFRIIAGGYIYYRIAINDNCL